MKLFVRHIGLRLLCILVAALLATIVAPAQTASTGAIAGT